jgi:hypothetical protein
MTKHSLDQMHQDYQDSVLNGDPEKELPSYDEVRRMFEKMYDLFHLTDTDGTTNSSISEEDALMFINGRMSANPWSSTFHEVDVCKVMFLADDTNLTIEDESAMDLTLEDMEAVGQACYHASVSVSLPSGYHGALNLWLLTYMNIFPNVTSHPSMSSASTQTHFAPISKLFSPFNSKSLVR